ncbi:MAG: C39 family peptidase [Eubacteriales bacterium]|nr:C39 family peptidase [Eubacteriales bacterium]
MNYENSKTDSRGNYKRIIWIAEITFLILTTAALAYLRDYWSTTDPIPSSLLRFSEKYPEAKTFVMEYPQKKDLDVKIDLTNEVVPGEIPLFIQWDERWGYKTYGSDCMGVTGCGPTCISMIECGLTGNLAWNPYETAKYAEDQGYYVDGSGTAWGLMTDGASAFGLKASRGIVSEEYIRENLSPQTPMIASMLPGDFTYTGHFIVLTGIDQEGNVTVNDPNSRRNSEKTWPADTLAAQMAAIWRYSAEG